MAWRTSYGWTGALPGDPEPLPELSDGEHKGVESI
jgi:hypothetical protein